MKVARLKIERFRGIKEATLLFPNHAVLVGDNNVGKSTVFEALDLVLGPDRLGRRPIIDEHDFHLGEYLSEEGKPRKEIRIEVTVTSLTDEQKDRFVDSVEWWDASKNDLHTEQPPEGVDKDHISPALRVTFIGYYDPEEDDFTGQTYFTRSLTEDDGEEFRKKDKQYCGFLYLRSLRTGTRALSLEHGSLLDIILRLKDIRPQMWEKTIKQMSDVAVASDPALGISEVLENLDAAIKRYVPREWGVAPHLKVSSLTREHLRKVITAFVGTGEGKHAAPFYRQGTGTVNMLVLALLSLIAEGKQNVIFAMEEPETAIPPYAQKRIVHEIRKLSAQSLFTSHSPYVIEEFNLEEVTVLTRPSDGVLKQAKVELPASVKHKRYRQEFRTRFCEGLLSRRVLLAEGATEASSMPAAARRLSEIDPAAYSSFEALGICVIDAGSDSMIADLGKLYRSLGKTVFGICDKQKPQSQQSIEAQIDKLFMHVESDFEKLVLKNTTQAAMDRFIDAIQWPSHLTAKYPTPKTNAAAALGEYFGWTKGQWGIADFLAQCTEQEIPQWLRTTCKDLRAACHPPPKAAAPAQAAAPAAPPPPPPPPDAAAPAAAPVDGAALV
jgi:putative ATP-dependent endonuclease of the OLD family